MYLGWKLPDTDYQRDGGQLENNYWYVLGYCHFREDYRQFRNDSMLKIQRTEKYFTRKHCTIDEHRNKKEATTKTKIQILVDRKIARYRHGSRKQYGFISEEIRKDGVEMTFLCSDLDEEFPRWHLMFGDYAKILEPESLRQRVRLLLKKAD